MANTAKSAKTPSRHCMSTDNPNNILTNCTKNGTIRLEMTDKKVPARFYKNEAGKEPVRDWLKNLGQSERYLIGTDIKTVEYGWPIGMPTCRPLGKGLFEVRTNLPDGIARVIFCFYEDQLILLHGFIKKTQKTPKADLDLALSRKRDLEERE